MRAKELILQGARHDLAKAISLRCRISAGDLET